MSLETFYNQKCVLCYKSEWDSVQQRPEIKYSDVLACLKYIPPDINQTVDWNQLGQNNSLLLCDICRENFGSLSKLSFDLEEIQRKINNLVQGLVLHIEKERGDYNGRQSKPVKSSLDFSANVDDYEDLIDSDCNDSNAEEILPNKLNDLETMAPEQPTSSSLKSTFSSEIQCKVQRKSKSNLYKLLGSTCGYECSACGKKFSRYEILQKHECEILSTNEILLNHKLRHEGEKPFQCSQCGSVHRTEKGLKSHEHFHDDNGKFSCEICGKTWKNLLRLKIHLRIHEERVQCEICGQSLVKTNLALHKQRIHHLGKQLKCNICDQEFSNTKALFCHGLIFCHICNKSFSERSLLSKHQIKVHTVNSSLYSESDNNADEERNLKNDRGSFQDKISSESFQHEDEMEHSDVKVDVKVEVKSEDTFSEIEDSDF